jgi:hypothetical protein
MIPSESGLLDLPNPCLVAVMCCCAEDLHSLFSAARAHSRLHQAAVLAISSIRTVVRQQQQADSVLLYLSNHGQHVDSIDLAGLEAADSALFEVRELPRNKLQGLSSLAFSRMRLQLQPGDGFKGVFGAGVPLQQLHIHQCELLDGEQGLVAALVLLPKLQYLSFVNNYSGEVTDMFLIRPCS